MWATFLAGPLGNRPKSSLVETPVPVVIWRRVGALPRFRAFGTAVIDHFPMGIGQFGDALFFGHFNSDVFVPFGGLVMKPSSLT